LIRGAKWLATTAIRILLNQKKIKYGHVNGRSKCLMAKEIPNSHAK
jgi:hypothetical protein